MKTRTLLSFLFLTSSLCFSQNLTRDSGQIISGSNIGFISGNHLPDSFLKSNQKVLGYEDIDGSPYINNNSGANNDLPIGKVYSSNLKYIGTALIRYNAYTDDMEVSLLEDGIDYYLLKKQPDFHYIDLGKTRYRAYPFDENRIGFFVLLTEKDNGKYTLLKKQKINFIMEKKASHSFVTSDPAKFKRASDIYYLKFNDDVMLLPKKKKEFSLFFKENSKAIKEYIKLNKLKISKEEDLKIIINYLNTL